jgi:hypothetical protein
VLYQLSYTHRDITLFEHLGLRVAYGALRPKPQLGASGRGAYMDCGDVQWVSTSDVAPVGGSRFTRAG